MNQQERESLYDTEIAPALLEIGRRCQESGLSFLAVVEWEPGQQGRTMSILPSCGLGIRWADIAARSNGNADSLIMAMMKHGTEYGHSSACLKLLGVPLVPVPKTTAARPNADQN